MRLRAYYEGVLEWPIAAESLVVPVHIIVEGLCAAEHVLAGEGFTALANLIALLGFLGVSAPSLYSLFRGRKGRRIETPQKLPNSLRIDMPLELLIRIYNDAEVQKQLRQILDPLRKAGIEKFETRRGGRVLEVVTKQDLLAADEAEGQDLTQDEEVVLGIEKVAWRRNLAWHFNNGRISFDARIEDERFWERVEQGEAFSNGDSMRVHLRTTTKRTRKGALKVERVIPSVISVNHARRLQGNLFEAH